MPAASLTCGKSSWGCWPCAKAASAAAAKAKARSFFISRFSLIAETRMPARGGHSCIGARPDYLAAEAAAAFFLAAFFLVAFFFSVFISLFMPESAEAAGLAPEAAAIGAPACEAANAV